MAALAVSGGWLVAAPVLHAEAFEHFPPLKPAPVRPQVRKVSKPLSGATVTDIIVEGTGLQPPVTSDLGIGPGRRLSMDWQPFLGRPISPDLIRDIEAAIEQNYADSNQAVIARWVPDEGAKTGVVRISVSRMVLGEVTVRGARKRQGDYIRRRLKLTNGRVVNGARFDQDLAELNRYPFRSVEATFAEKGETTDLDLLVTNHKPWEAYAGFKYGGSKDLTYRRYYLGGSVGNLLGPDSLLSFQFTGSPDMALHGNPHPRFKESFFSYALPVARDTQIEASLDISELNFTIAPQSYRFVDIMAQAGLRHDLASKRAGVASDIRFGIEAKNELELIFTNGLTSTRRASEVFQAYVGYHRTSDRNGRHDDLDLVLHFSPGNLDPGNADRQAAIYSEGRQTSQTYAYLGYSYDRVQPLSQTFTWHSQVSGQLASGPIPFSEQAGLGSLTLVRGYYFIDGTYDSTLVLRNELSLHRGIKPYVFYDCGAGRDIGLRHSDTLASAGLGMKLNLGKPATLRIEAVQTLRAGQFTARGTNELLAELTVRY